MLGETRFDFQSIAGCQQQAAIVVKTKLFVGKPIFLCNIVSRNRHESPCRLVQQQ